MAVYISVNIFIKGHKKISIYRKTKRLYESQIYIPISGSLLPRGALGTCSGLLTMHSLVLATLQACSVAKCYLLAMVRQTTHNVSSGWPELFLLLLFKICTSPTTYQHNWKPLSKLLSCSRLYILISKMEVLILTVF